MVEVVKNEATGRAYFSGLQQCGSVWGCPDCHGKINLRRGDEVRLGVGNAEAQGIKPYLLTVTFPHELGDDTRAQTKAMCKAWSRLFSGASATRAKARFGIVGHIRGVEGTHGRNGWHPHIHAVLLVGEDADADELRAELLPRWQAAAVACGLGRPSDENGLRVDGGESAAEYITKAGRDVASWGMDMELTGVQAKKGKKGSMTPYEVLAKYGEYKHKDKARASYYAQLWRDYVDSFRGIRQLVWSRGLKALLGVDEKDDQALLEEPQKGNRSIFGMYAAEFKAVQRTGQKVRLLEIAETAPERLPDFVAWCVRMYEKQCARVYEKPDPGD